MNFHGLLIVGRADEQRIRLSFPQDNGSDVREVGPSGIYLARPVAPIPDRNAPAARYARIERLEAFAAAYVAASDLDNAEHCTVEAEYLRGCLKDVGQPVPPVVSRITELPRENAPMQQAA